MGNFVLQSPIRRREPGSGDGRWARRGITVAALALGAGLLAGVSTGSSPSTNVHFTPLTPPFKVINNTGIGANATRVVAVTGGSTQVPTNATTLQLTINVKGTKAGTLSFYPTGNPAGTSGQTVSWVAGGTGTGTIQTDVGQRNSLSVKNTSIATATVTATITGYSTEVEARDISGVGGTAGEALVNDGAGGAAWQPPGRAWSWQNVGSYPLGTTQSPVAVVDLPAGTFMISFYATIHKNDSVNPLGWCSSTDGHFHQNFYLAGPHQPVTGTWLTTRGTAGQLYVTCRSANGLGMTIVDPTLVALEIGEGNIG